jgi:hypothetical protein
MPGIARQRPGAEIDRRTDPMVQRDPSPGAFYRGSTYIGRRCRLDEARTVATPAARPAPLPSQAEAAGKPPWAQLREGDEGSWDPNPFGRP